MMTHSAEQFTQQPNAERHALYPTAESEPEVTTDTNDETIIRSTNSTEVAAAKHQKALEVYQKEAYILTHKKVVDYVAAQQRYNAGLVTDKQLSLVRENLVHHVTREIMHGLPVDPVLHFEDAPNADDFVTYVVEAYISAEAAKVSEQLNNDSISTRRAPLDDQSDTLFSDDFLTQTAPLPITVPEHITETPAEAMTPLEKRDWKRFASIMRSAGGYAVEMLGVSVHSNPTPIVGPTGTKTLEVVSEDSYAA
tara:strand:- start:476 stop:1231 length:756 start_codon:yes stop_codon:yes gene_type:complete